MLLSPLSFLRRIGAVLLMAAAICGAAAVHAAPGVDAQVIVRLRAEQLGSAPRDADSERQQFQTRLDGVARRQSLPPLQGARNAIGNDHRVVRASGMDSKALAAQLARDPAVVYAVPDRRVRRAAVPNDPLFNAGGSSGPAAGQWYLKSPTSTQISAIDAQGAWDITQGSGSVVVAVLDTGIRPEHPDLAGKLVPGYDFVSGANGNKNPPGRQADNTDPGDWVDQSDIDTGVVSSGCSVEDSTWHGTQVAGIIGAQTNNGGGIASVGWGVRVMPLRVLGKCDGSESDIAAAMLWAAGIHVPGVPDNPNKARVINLSLGSDGDCGQLYTDTINQVIAAGVVVVASAGNSTGHAASAPANCPGVIGVGGLRHIGTKVGFSDLGPAVAISAPGGNCVLTGLTDPCLYPIATTSNSGLKGPVNSIYTDSYNASVGTSFSAPQVAGAVALMLSVQPAMTPAAVRSALTSSARPFPTSGADPGTPQCLAPQFNADGTPKDQPECYCTTATCGAGMLDVRAAVQAVLGVVARISVSPAAPQPGLPLTLSAADSVVTAGRSITSVSWSLVDGGGIVTALGAADTLTTTATPSAAGSFTVALTVSDNGGSSSTVQRVVVVTAPAAAAVGGGGGGALGFEWLALLALAVIAALRVSRRARPWR